MTTTTNYQPDNELGPWVPDAQSFGARLLILRHAMKWTNVAMAARACGIPVGTWRQWEAGTRPQNMDEIADKITHATGVNQLWLMTGRVLTNVEVLAAAPQDPSTLVRSYLTVLPAVAEVIDLDAFRAERAA